MKAKMSDFYLKILQLYCIIFYYKSILFTFIFNFEPNIFPLNFYLFLGFTGYNGVIHFVYYLTRSPRRTTPRLGVSGCVNTGNYVLDLCWPLLLIITSIGRRRLWIVVYSNI